MVERLLKVAFIILGALAADQGLSHGLKVWPAALGSVDGRYEYRVLAAVVGAFIGLLVAPAVIRGGQRAIGGLITRLQRVPVQDIVAGVVGLISGLIISSLLTQLLPRTVPFLGDYLPLALTLLLTYVAVAVSVKKREDVAHLFQPARRGTGYQGFDWWGPVARPSQVKILDTSVIIDGRVADIVRTGFLEGTLVIPEFVLRELQHIADSSDVLKRNRGRRGLDILKQMQKEGHARIEVVDRDFDDLTEVDAKLVRLAKLMDGQVITNDFNLNKVAELHGVPVLNINELANALKPVVLPGEEMTVHVIKDGKEQGQGVAYLDDGTMIVIDGGRRYIGQTVDVVVTSVLQTAAGRMIFAKPQEAPAMVTAGRHRPARETG